MKSLSVEAKLKIIKRVQNGEKVAKVCREARISRKTFYQWLLKFKSSKPHLVHIKLADKRFKHVFKFKTLPREQKLLLVNQVLAGFGSVSEICRNFGVSRKTFYKWFKRYREVSDDGLFDLRPKGEKHYRAISEQLRNQVISAVAANPEFSVHQLSKTFVGTVGHHGIQNILDRYSLNTYDKRVAFATASGQRQKVKVAPLYQPEIPLYRLRQLLAPFVTIPKLLVTNPKSGILASIGLLIPLSVVVLWFRLLLSAPAGSSIIGLFFASIALTLGLFFFIYSMKYYIAALMVLQLAQFGVNQSQSQKSKLREILSKVGLRLPQRQGVNPLNINLEKVKLEGEKPFVSIHVAVYNEKKVVERLIRACTAQEWFTSLLSSSSNRGSDSRLRGNDNGSVANYEVIIADDSTDETMEIAREVLLSMDYSVARERYDPPSPEATEGQGGMEIFRFSPPPESFLPIVKIVHRFNRAGFKGGALYEALQNTDARAEYIMVLDADFVPYPDTIEQFVKTFQVLDANEMRMEIPRIDANERTGDISINSHNSNSYVDSHNNIAAVQGYQWHVLNKSQTWVTRGVRTEYAGSYVVERSGEEIYGGLKQIAGSVYAIRADILRQFGWGTSITEDFELTLRLYEAGYKVVFTPYIQVPAEAVSTIKRLIRQRMRWAEGASFNVKIMLSRMLWGHWESADSDNTRNRPIASLFHGSIAEEQNKEQFNNVNNETIEQSGIGNKGKIWVPSKLTLTEKLEFLYLAPYYLQAAFFLVGTLSWFLSEAVFGARLPFWTAALGWSLVFTNLLALPLMNIVGMFLEESEERDYIGILSFIALSYIVVPFQAYAAIKGFLEKEEGPWFRTPKTGTITDVVKRMGGFHLRLWPFGQPAVAMRMQTDGKRMEATERMAYVPLWADNFRIRPRHIRWVGNFVLGLTVGLTVLMSVFAPFIPQATSYASEPALRTVEKIQQETGNLKQETRNQSDEITTPRAIKKTTRGGKNIEFIFHKEPRVRMKLDGHQQIEFETRTVFGQKANPTKSIIYQDKEVIYEEIIPNVDLKYSITDDLLVEEFILKAPINASNSSTPEESKPTSGVSLAGTIEQSVKTVDVKVVWADETAFGFYSEKEEGQELFRLSQPFAKDAKGETTDNLQLTIDKELDGYRLVKTLGTSAKTWLADPTRVYPISIDPSVIVTGGIAEAEVQFGGLQRKLVYASSNWYAFYNCDANPCSSGTGGKVYYQKSSDGSSWGGYVDVDSTDSDNYNPSVWLEGSKIYVVWLDNGDDDFEVNTIDTASADALGTKCETAIAGPPSLGTTMTHSITVTDDGTVYFASSDTSTDTEAYVFSLVFSGCTFTDITSGSGLTAGDRPVLVSTGNTVHLIFQDGNLSRSTRADGAWNLGNNTVASVTDNIYDVTTDGTAVWPLTVSGTTATNFYRYDTVFIEDIDTSIGSGTISKKIIAIDCPAADDCKLVYFDDASNYITFVDCNDADCDSPTLTNIDTDAGEWGAGTADIYCPTATDCKIVYYDGTDNDITFVDCANAACSSQDTGSPADIDTDVATGAAAAVYCPADDGADCKVAYKDGTDGDITFADCNNAACSAPTLTDIDTDVGLSTYVDIDCPSATDCKIAYFDATDSDITFADCANAACSTTNCDTNTNCTDIDTDVGGSGQASIYCPAAADCKVVYNDSTDSDITFADCNDATCSAPTLTDIDTFINNSGQASIYCPAADDCKVAYYDNSANKDINFVDCANASCSSSTITQVDSSTVSGQTDIFCPAANDCKVIYLDLGEGDLTFADCSDATCGAASTLTAPWTGETGVESVSISYDSTNSDLYAHIIMDDPSSQDQAFFKSTDAASISWTPSGDGTSYVFTAGDLGHISSPMTGAGTSQIGVVLRQGTNFEFAVVPEKTLFLLAAVPFLPKFFGRLNRRKTKKE